MAQQEFWDVFLSYSSSPNSNSEKVLSIQKSLENNLQIKTWIDVVQLKSGVDPKKVLEGITNSKLFVCFITSSYSDDKACMRQLWHAKKLGKKIIFFLNEGSISLTRIGTKKNSLKGFSFFMGEDVYHSREEALLDAIKDSLNKYKVF